MNNLIDLLTNADFLSHVPCEKIHFPVGSVILREDEEGQDLYLLISGEADVSGSPIDQEQGAMIKLARLGPGESFGELSVFDCGPRSARVVAHSDCEIYKVNGQKLIGYLDDHPENGYFVIRELFMNLILYFRQNNMRTRMAVQMYLREHDTLE